MTVIQPVIEGSGGGSVTDYDLTGYTLSITLPNSYSRYSDARYRGTSGSYVYHEIGNLRFKTEPIMIFGFTYASSTSGGYYVLISSVVNTIISWLNTTPLTNLEDDSYRITLENGGGYLNMSGTSWTWSAYIDITVSNGVISELRNSGVLLGTTSTITTTILNVEKIT